MVYSSYSGQQASKYDVVRSLESGETPVVQEKLSDEQLAGQYVEKNAGNGLYARYGKRILDLTITLAAAPVWLPLTFFLAIGVMLDGANPIYVQQRLGKGGRVFRMVKLRSMVVGADDKLAAYLQENPTAKAEWDEKQKLVNDPRITSYGRLLRKSSLDELPQLWNVLCGHMSLVGPRPMMVEQRELYPGTAYFELRPGITGPWQVSGRHATSFADRAKYDHDYLAEVSFVTDARIILQTFVVVVAGKGA